MNTTCFKPFLYCLLKVDIFVFDDPGKWGCSN